MKTEFERASQQAAELAHGLGTRVFLYRNAEGRPRFTMIHPADAWSIFELVETFEPGAVPARFDSVLPAAPMTATTPDDPA